MRRRLSPAHATEAVATCGLQAWQKKKVFKRLEEQVEEQILQLQFLQLLCEGHNRQLQNFLRVQGASTAAINVDVLAQLVEYTVM